MKDFSRRFFKAFTLFLLVFIAFGLTLHHYPFYACGGDEAYSAIHEADNLLQQAFVAVSEAKRSGANISGLLIKLDSAGNFLAEAQICYRNGDFEGAVYSANLSVQSVEGLVEEAEQLKALATAEYRQRSFQTMATSSLAVVAIVLGCAVVWRLFKQRYFEKVLKMKPEVGSDES